MHIKHDEGTIPIKAEVSDWGHCHWMGVIGQWLLLAVGADVAKPPPSEHPSTHT